jgi:hypothetical protein
VNRRQALAALSAVPGLVRISLQPTDTIVIEVDRIISAEQVETIKTIVDRVWTNQKCLVLERGVSFKVVRS